jgi:hypothetical protein
MMTLLLGFALGLLCGSLFTGIVLITLMDQHLKGGVDDVRN